MTPGAPRSKKIYVIAGEASGDLHGANLIHSLQSSSLFPLEIYGVGGDKIQETGAKRFFDLAHFHVTGISQAIKKLPDYQKAARVILKDLREVSPDLVILIDNPGFNLHLAKKIHAMKIPVVYYIAPQLWAWKKNRIHKIKRTVSKMLVVFDFEKKLYEDYGVPVSFVGHPLKDLIDPSAWSKTAKENKIVLLPGSRKHEVETLLPIFIAAAEKIRLSFPEMRFEIIQSPTLKKEFYQKFLQGEGNWLTLKDRESYRKIAQSKVALVCSGTATLECALLGTPMVISNRASFLTYVLAKLLIRIPFLGLPNIILNRMAMPELMQYEAQPDKIAAKTVEILGSKGILERMEKDLLEVSEKLGSGGAHQNAAREVLAFLEDR